MYPNLKGILLPKIDACIGLLIGNDVPKALEPKEIRECTEQGPFAIWTMFGWMINSPLERKGNYLHTANFIRADDELSQQFAKFCSLKFSNYIYDNDHALSIMEQSVTLKEGHCKVPLPWRNTLPYFLHNQPLVEHRLKLWWKTAERPRTSLEVFFIHGWPGVERPRSQGTTGPAGSSCQCFVVSTSSPCSQSKQARQNPRHVWLYGKTPGNITKQPTPDLTNNLIGILTHFEQEPVTLMAGRCFTKSVPILMTMMPYSSAPHCYQAVQTSVFGESQRTISGNSGRKQLTASKTTSTSMTALSQSHRKIRPLYWWRSSVNYSLKEDFPWLNGSLTCEKLLSPSWGQDLWKMRNLICGQLRLWPIMVSSYIHPARWWSERTIPFYLGVGKEIQIFLLMVALVIWCT